MIPLPSGPPTSSWAKAISWPALNQGRHAAPRVQRMSAAVRLAGRSVDRGWYDRNGRLAAAADTPSALDGREETRPMANIDAHTRHLLVQNAELSSQRIANSRKSRIDAIADMCS